MNREVVQDFLNLPGIVGVALMDGRSRPYFCGIDQTLNLKQKEALSQGIQQVVATTPADFQFFEFRFIEHQVHIYKLNQGIILLVLSNSRLNRASYFQAIELLKAALQSDVSSAIATFRLLAGTITLSDPNSRKRQVSAPPKPPNSGSNGAATPKLAPPKPLPVSSTPAIAAPPPEPVTPQSTLKDLLSALNHLSQFTTQYLGTTVITNYWKATRPPIEWLSHFQIDRAGGISFSEALSLQAPAISLEQQQWIQQWVVAFIQRCSKVIRDFPQIIKHAALDDRQKTLLLPPDF